MLVGGRAGTHCTAYLYTVSQSSHAHRPRLHTHIYTHTHPYRCTGKGGAQVVAHLTFCHSNENCTYVVVIVLLRFFVVRVIINSSTHTHTYTHILWHTLAGTHVSHGYTAAHRYTCSDCFVQRFFVHNSFPLFFCCSFCFCFCFCFCFFRLSFLLPFLFSPFLYPASVCVAYT